MIIDNLSAIKSQNLFFNCRNFLSVGQVYIKLEGLNIAGSIKLKTAIHLVNGLEQKYGITPKTHKLIESSSGNLGLALSIVAKERGYTFTCVIDPNITPANEKCMELFGASLIKVTEPDAAGGYLTTRIKLIQEIIANDPSYIWTNQYANQDNINAHYIETATEILQIIPKVDYLFVGAGTTGTLMGCAKFFKLHSPLTKIIAVDTLGSVTFDFPPAKRYIPGLGTSRKPEIVNKDLIDDLVLVSEKDASIMCRRLLQEYGLFLGGSSGSVLHAVKNYKYLRDNFTVVAISPDFGQKYIDTIYNTEWFMRTFIN
jgi:2,3-diaminopropionate biosynthesis protein SbnA